MACATCTRSLPRPRMTCLVDSARRRSRRPAAHVLARRSLAARPIHLDPAIVPWPLAVELVDRDPEGPARRHVASRVCGARTDVPLGEVVHDRERSAVLDARATVHDQVGKQESPVVLLGMEGEGDAWVTPETGGPLGVEERREDDLVAIEAGPAQVDVGLTVRGSSSRRVPTARPRRTRERFQG